MNDKKKCEAILKLGEDDWTGSEGIYLDAVDCIIKTKSTGVKNNG